MGDLLLNIFILHTQLGPATINPSGKKDDEILVGVIKEGQKSDECGWNDKTIKFGFVTSIFPHIQWMVDTISMN